MHPVAINAAKGLSPFPFLVRPHGCNNLQSGPLNPQQLLQKEVGKVNQTHYHWLKVMSQGW